MKHVLYPSLPRYTVPHRSGENKLEDHAQLRKSHHQLLPGRYKPAFTHHLTRKSTEKNPGEVQEKRCVVIQTYTSIILQQRNGRSLRV